MFGLVDKEMRDNVNALKKMIGIKSPVPRRQKTNINTRDHIGISSVDSSLTGKKSGQLKQMKILTTERSGSQGNTMNLVSPGMRLPISRKLSGNKLNY